VVLEVVLVLVTLDILTITVLKADSALEAVSRGSTTIGIKTPTFAILSSHIKPTKPLAEPAEKIFTIDTLISIGG
jgi:proteasome alpha subunit